MLMHIRAADTTSIVRLRSALGWDLPKFTSAMFGLIERGLLTRDSSDRLKISTSGIDYVASTAEQRRVVASSFQEECRAPQLPVNSLYLPDYSRFEFAMRRSVYTS